MDSVLSLVVVAVVMIGSLVEVVIRSLTRWESYDWWESVLLLR